MRCSTKVPSKQAANRPSTPNASGKATNGAMTAANLASPAPIPPIMVKVNPMAKATAKWLHLQAYSSSGRTIKPTTAKTASNARTA